jgi:hypothetical protein
MRVDLDLGAQLWRLLPAIYRERDNSARDVAGRQPSDPGDLEKCLAAAGDLPTRVHRTLVQMLYDHFPDEAGSDENGTPRSCQPWLLPYFAQLLDVALVSPDVNGQRAEVANAVAWRQAKGTQPCVEQIAEAVGETEVEAVEGWKRVALTPRLGNPLLPARALGEKHEMDMDALSPPQRARHPGLPSGTVDLRQRARAVRCDADNPVAETSTMGGVQVTWRLAHPHGAPCLPGSYQDPSRRTVDLRTPSWRRGHFHPRRLMLFLPPPDGFFGGADSIPWSLVRDATELVDSDLVEVTTGTTTFGGATRTLRTIRGLTSEPLRVRGAIEVGPDVIYRFENLWLDNTVTVSGGRVELDACAVRKLVVETATTDEPVLHARATLVRTLQAASGLVRLEYVTVLAKLVAEAIWASDSILVPKLHRNVTGPDAPTAGCLRFSAIADQALPGTLAVSRRSVTRVAPWFLNVDFGTRGCGVLHPLAAEAIRSGAEDGGEMGAYHQRRYCLRQAAIVAKLADYLPVGIEPILVLDSTLSCPPPSNP